MNFTEVTLSYPCILYKAEVSHFTSRKSTAIEWVILEAITKCEKLSNYSEFSIANFFEKFFTISDADLLIRPVLISLQDIGAIIISGIDETGLLQSVDIAVEMNKAGDYGTPVPDYIEENVSSKVIKIIQSYTGIVNKMVWRKY